MTPRPSRVIEILITHLLNELFSCLLNIMAAVAVNGKVGFEGIVLFDHALDGGEVLAEIVATKSKDTIQ